MENTTAIIIVILGILAAVYAYASLRRRARKRRVMVLIDYATVEKFSKKDSTDMVLSGDVWYLICAYNRPPLTGNYVVNICRWPEVGGPIGKCWNTHLTRGYLNNKIEMSSVDAEILKSAGLTIKSNKSMDVVKK